jgi:hypothetical protein
MKASRAVYSANSLLRMCAPFAGPALAARNLPLVELRSRCIRDLTLAEPMQHLEPQLASAYQRLAYDRRWPGLASVVDPLRS